MPEPTDRDRDMALNVVEELEQLAVELPVYFGDWLERQFAQARREGREEGVREAHRIADGIAGSQYLPGPLCNAGAGMVREALERLLDQPPGGKTS